jgi:uncharacterized membrane protein YqjE
MPEKEERSIGELIANLASETGTLVRQEIALAKVELGQKATWIGSNIAQLAIGGAVAYAALLALLAGVIGLLATAMAWWAAAIVVAVVVGIVGAVMISKALESLKRTELAPRQTVETLKEDAEWAKQQVK